VSLAALEYVSQDALFNYQLEESMTIQEILVAAERYAESKGIEIKIPAALQFGDLQDITDTFCTYGEDDYADEFKNRYIHAELEAA
jgi:hypothetical protein